MRKRKVQFTGVRIEGFRSCERTTFNPSIRLSALVGPNGAGKTNVLQAITLLTGGRPRRRPGVHGIGDAASSTCRIVAEFQVGRTTVLLRSTLRYSLDEESREIVVGSREEWREGRLASANKRTADWIEIPLEYVAFAYGEPDNSIGRDAREFKRLRRFGYVYDRMSKARKKEFDRLFDLAQRVFEFRTRIGYYSASQFTNPARCPSFFEIDEKRDLVAGGARFREHQKFLLDLYRLWHADSDLYAAYLHLVGKNGLRLISSIHWKEVKVASSQVDVRTGGKIERKRRQRLLVVPSIKSGVDRLSFNQLSEGTFKSLALIFYLITDNSDLLLVEEPEVCVHHGLLTSIVELIKSQSSQKQIIFSTHSDFVLDQLEPANVFSVAKTESHGTTVKSLANDLPAKKFAELREFLRESGNLGDLWRQGGLDD
jgi:hypothetical protein